MLNAGSAMRTKNALKKWPTDNSSKI